VYRKVIVNVSERGAVQTAFSLQVTDGVLQGALLDNPCQKIDEFGL
jgi:hypothetical protein